MWYKTYKILSWLKLLLYTINYWKKVKDWQEVERLALARWEVTPNYTRGDYKTVPRQKPDHCTQNGYPHGLMADFHISPVCNSLQYS